ERREQFWGEWTLAVLNRRPVAIVANQQFCQHDGVGKAALRIRESAVAAEKSARAVHDVLQVFARSLVLGNWCRLIGILDHHLHELVTFVVRQMFAADVVGIVAARYRAHRMARDESVERDDSRDALGKPGGVKVRELDAAAETGNEQF